MVRDSPADSRDAGDMGLILGLERSPGEGNDKPLIFMGFPGGSVVKNSRANAGDSGSISGPGRFPGGGNGNHSSILDLKTPCTEEPGGL